MRERRAPFPLLPIPLLRQPTIWRSDALAACHGATLVSLITFLPIYLRVLRGTSASETGLLLLPLMFGIGGGSMLTGRIVSRTGLTTIFPSVGLIFATAPARLLGLLAGHLGTRQLALLLFVNGLFMGTVMGVVQVTVQNAAGPPRSAPPPPRCSSRARSAPPSARRWSAPCCSPPLSLSDPEPPACSPPWCSRGPDALAALPPERQAIVLSEIAVAFRTAFLTIAAFAGHRRAARLDHPDATAELSWPRALANVTLPPAATRPRQQMAPIPL